MKVIIGAIIGALTIRRVLTLVVILAIAIIGFSMEDAQAETQPIEDTQAGTQSIEDTQAGTQSIILRARGMME